MMPPYLQLITLIADTAIIFFVTYYFFKFRAKEKKIEGKENKVDTKYHEVVDNALSKERKILDDAAHAADQIMTGANYVNRNIREEVYLALRNMGADIQKEAAGIARDFLNSYKHSLEKITTDSLTSYQNNAKNIDSDLQKQIQEFNNSSNSIQKELQEKIKEFYESRLATLEKELEDYKQYRIKQSEQIITSIVNEASRELLKKTISIEDNEKLITEALEQAKRKGVFE